MTRSMLKLPPSLTLLAAICFAGCGDGYHRHDHGHTHSSTCDCRRERQVPFTGHAELLARSTHHDYIAATMSFTHATTEDLEWVYNDWDLEFGNDPEDMLDLFSVNTVTDDRSFIVDLGPVCFDEVPERVNVDDFERGYWDEHDDIPVVLDHTYLVRTVDTETCQYAALRVTHHDMDHLVEFSWVRSPERDRFVMP